MFYPDEVKLWGDSVRYAVIDADSTVAKDYEVLTFDSAMKAFDDRRPGTMLVKTSWPYPCGFENDSPLYAVKDILSIKR